MVGQIVLGVAIALLLLTLTVKYLMKEVEKSRKRRNGGNGTRRFVYKQIARERGASFQILTRGGKLG